jgi:hypothetical protein
MAYWIMRFRQFGSRPSANVHHPPGSAASTSRSVAAQAPVMRAALSFYPDYHLIEELFNNPARMSRPRYRETLSGFLRDPDTSPEPLRRLAARDPAKASTVFARLLKRKRFSWDADGEQLLRRSKPRYFEETPLPRTVPLSGLLSDALQHTR